MELTNNFSSENSKEFFNPEEDTKMLSQLNDPDFEQKWIQKIEKKQPNCFFIIAKPTMANVSTQGSTFNIKKFVCALFDEKKNVFFCTTNWNERYNTIIDGDEVACCFDADSDIYHGFSFCVFVNDENVTEKFNECRNVEGVIFVEFITADSKRASILFYIVEKDGYFTPTLHLTDDPMTIKYQKKLAKSYMKYARSRQSSLNIF